MRASLWALLVSCVLASPPPSPSDPIPTVVVSDHSTSHHGYFLEQDKAYSAAIFGWKCTDVQIRYIKQELDEVQDMLVQATTQLGMLGKLIRDGKQPKDWGRDHDDNTRLLHTWEQYFGYIQLNPSTEKEGAPPIPWPTTLTNIDHVIAIYEKLHAALSSNTVRAIFHCSDNFFRFTNARMNEKGGIERLYMDTRQVPPHFIWVPMRVGAEAKGGFCFEDADVRAWTFNNPHMNKDEICICPETFNAAKQANKLTEIENEKSTLTGRTIDSLKLRTIAGTLLHELTHSVDIMGADKTGDEIFTTRGTTYPATGAENCRGLAFNEPDKSWRNADTLSLFAIAMYYNKCNWASDTCGKAEDVYQNIAFAFT